MAPRDKLDSETQRIMVEYERRRLEIPSDFYSYQKPANLFLYSQRARTVLRLLAREGMWPLEGLDLLEIGYGSGQWLLDFVQWGADPESLAGIEIDPTAFREAKRRLPASDIRLGNASHLPWRDASFDLVLQSTVFTSIIDKQMRRRVAGEMLRILKPLGIILWYDFRFNNPMNPNVEGIESAEISSLFPDCTVRLERLTLAPPIARLIVHRSWILALLLEKVRFLKTHYLGVIRKAQK